MNLTFISRNKIIPVAACFVFAFSIVLKAEDSVRQMDNAKRQEETTPGMHMYQVTAEFLKNIEDNCYHNQYDMFYAYGGSTKRGIALVQNGKLRDKEFPPVKHIALKKGYAVKDIAPNFPNYIPSNKPVHYNGLVRLFPCIGTITHTMSDGNTSTLYLSQTDCDGFANFILCQVSPEAYLELPIAKDNKPWRSAGDYAVFFQEHKNTPTKYWKTITTSDSSPNDLMQAEPGDILAWKEEPSGGHIMIIASKPVLTNDYYCVSIIDSTNVSRFKDSQVNSEKRMLIQKVPDTVPPTYVSGEKDIARARSGVGSGEIHLYYDKNSAVKWSCQSNEKHPRTYFKVFSIGRLISQ